MNIYNTKNNRSNIVRILSTDIKWFGLNDDIYQIVINGKNSITYNNVIEFNYNNAIHNFNRDFSAITIYNTLCENINDILKLEIYNDEIHVNINDSLNALLSLIILLNTKKEEN